MALTTQDLEKGIDITGQVNVTGSQLNQLVDAARSAVDKGLTVTTTDTAADTPEVPDPNGDYTGVFPTWWINYLWIRRPYVTETEQRVLCYMWDENVTPDATLLQWTLIDFNGTAALALATSHSALITTAQNTADTAQTNAENALTAAANAQETADGADTTATDAATAVASLTEVVNELWSPGDIKPTCAATVFSTASNEGWLECDGSAVDRDVFALLFDAIGTTWGIGDGVQTFNVPDFRGRTIIGAGTGSGLTARTLGQQTIGAETHTLTGPQTGLNQHKTALGQISHYNVTGETPDAGGIILGDFDGASDDVQLDSEADAGANTSHPNMQPSAVVRYLIKT